jgi:hypothetical protein
MGDTAEGQDGDMADSAPKPGFDMVEIVPDGDILLDVTFETSKETLRAAKKATKPRPGQQTAPPPVLKPRTRVRYRVQLAVLKENSKYFDNLLGDTRFAEARSIEESFQRLSLKGVKPSEAGVADLPVVKIHEDDEATQSAGQDAVFEDLMRILHRKQSTTKAVTMQSLAVLAVLADRFDCIAIVSRYLNALKYKWPATQTRLSKDDGPALSRGAEETLRQKILVSWLLDQPLKMHTATRELIMYGSRRWSASFDDEDESSYTAAWWDLPDDLESEPPLLPPTHPAQPNPLYTNPHPQPNSTTAAKPSSPPSPPSSGTSSPSTPPAPANANSATTPPPAATRTSSAR